MKTKPGFPRSFGKLLTYRYLMLWNEMLKKMLAGSGTFPCMGMEERRVHLASGTLVSSTMAFFGQMSLLWVRHQ